MQFELQIPNTEQMLQVGAHLAVSGVKQALIFLHGELGAGKTTLVRGLLQGFGYHGNVPSPTYTIVEPYELAMGMLFHCDLYRINDAEELTLIGMDDYLTQGWNCIEWPEKGANILPPADLSIYIDFYQQGRKLLFKANSELGEELLQIL